MSCDALSEGKGGLYVNGRRGVRIRMVLAESICRVSLVMKKDGS